MPYIKQELRDLIDPSLLVISARLYRDSNVGVLNYVITRLIDVFLGLNPDYSKFNAVIGVLECAKLELYRRMVVPYENLKCRENGDVYKE